VGAQEHAMSKKFSLSQPLRRTLYGHLTLARISNSPTVVSNTLAGAALAGMRLVDGKQILVAIAMILFYSAGMYLNDLFDYAIDSRARPERPLPAGIVSQRAAVRVVIALCGTGSVLLLIVGLYPFLSGLILIGLIICYDKWHKGNPFSPLLMALCRAMVYITAFLAFSASSIFNLSLPCGLLILYVIGLTSVARIENNIPTRNDRPLCRPGTLRLPRIAHIGIVITLFLPASYFAVRPSLLTLLFALFFTAWVVHNIFFIYDPSRPQVGRAVAQLIAGISLLDSLVLIVSENYQGLLLALIAFALTLFLQRYVKGT
jgi:4-hydroxybenzoate polyprenyltransferase